MTDEECAIMFGTDDRRGYVDELWPSEPLTKVQRELWTRKTRHWPARIVRRAIDDHAAESFARFPQLAKVLEKVRNSRLTKQEEAEMEQARARR